MKTQRVQKQSRPEVFFKKMFLKILLFLSEFCKIFKNIFLKNTSERQLLYLLSFHYVLKLVLLFHIVFITEVL